MPRQVTCQVCHGSGTVLVEVFQNGKEGDAVPVQVSQSCGGCSGAGTVEVADDDE